MLLVVTNTYVDEGHPYENSFIHSRMISYHRNGIDSEVFVLNSKKERRKYEFEGVKVEVGGIPEFINKVSETPNIRLCFHFISRTMIKALQQIEQPQKLIIFVHGVEALRWYERIFPGIFTTPKMFLGFLKYIVNNSINLRICQRFFSNTHHVCEFITVSEWMKKIAEKNWNCKGKYTWHIIPNYIDEIRFPYVEKKPEDARNLLSIRQFTTGKYANDLSVKLILDLISAKDGLNFTFVGDGPLFEKIMPPLYNKAEVKIEKRLLPQSEIPLYHSANGIFICPTRQDAQGVSMCEAMCSGLVPITLYNTAIPEYLPNDERLYCYSVQDMKCLILRLLEDPELYMELSKKCSDFIKEKCGESNTTKREMEIMADQS